MKKKKKVEFVTLPNGTTVELSAESVIKALAEARYEGRRQGEQEAERMYMRRPHPRDYRGYGHYGDPHDPYMERGHYREQLPPLEPENLAAARKEIAAEWEKEFEFAENLRAALSLAVQMFDDGDEPEEIRDMCQDALTDQPSPKLQRMVQNHRYSYRSSIDPAIEKHMRRQPNMPIKEPTPMKHHWYDDELYQAKKAIAGMKPVTAIYDELIGKLPAFTPAENPCGECEQEDAYEEVEVQELGGSTTKYTMPVTITVDKVTHADQTEAHWISSKSNTAQQT